MAKKSKQKRLKKEAALKSSPVPARSEKEPHPIPPRNRHPLLNRYLSLADVALGKKSHDRSKK